MFRGYPSIITTCYMDWLPSASALHLQQEAYAVLSETEFWESYDEDLRWFYIASFTLCNVLIRAILVILFLWNKIRDSGGKMVERPLSVRKAVGSYFDRVRPTI